MIGRLVVMGLAGLVFACLMILDPVALGQLGYACVTGHCGVRPRWVWAGLLAVVLAMAIIQILQMRRRRVVVPVKPAPRSRAPRTAKPVPPQAASARKRTRAASPSRVRR